MWGNFEKFLKRTYEVGIVVETICKGYTRNILR